MFTKKNVRVTLVILFSPFLLVLALYMQGLVALVFGSTMLLFGVPTVLYNYLIYYTSDRKQQYFMWKRKDRADEVVYLIVMCFVVVFIEFYKHIKYFINDGYTSDK